MAESNIAGTYRGSGPVIECILDEGAPTVSASVTMSTGQTTRALTWAAGLEEGMVVAISNDTANTYVATEGSPVVERAVNAEAFVIGTIVSTPRLKAFPAASGNADTLAKRLAGKFYRTALVELHIPGKVVAAQFMCNGTNALAIGVGATAKLNMAKCYTSGNRGYYFSAAASGGVGLIPLTYVAAGTDGDLETALFLLTGAIASQTGA